MDKMWILWLSDISSSNPQALLLIFSFFFQIKLSNCEQFYTLNNSFHWRVSFEFWCQWRKKSIEFHWILGWNEMRECLTWVFSVYDFAICNILFQFIFIDIINQISHAKQSIILFSIHSQTSNRKYDVKVYA